MEQLWTVKDCASFLKRSRSWIYQMVARGSLPCRSIGGVRFVPQEIRDWVVKQPRNGMTVIKLRQRI
jgi:predicted DNA-binding transcriptional regulator AlpA